MIGKTKVLWALVTALVLVGLSTQAATVSGPETLYVEDEMLDELNLLESIEIGDSGLEIPESDLCGERCELVKIGLFVRWGLLGDDREEGQNRIPDDHEERGILIPDEDADGEIAKMVPWDGFLQTTDGGVKLVKTVLFERGGEYRFGGDDFVYPQENRFTLEWRSSTTTHWDGLLMLVVVPRTRPMPHVTLHTEPWSHVFEAWQLIGLHRRIPVGDAGHEIEINGFLVKEQPNDVRFAVIVFSARWGYLDDSPDPVAREMVPWDGFISLTRGAVRLVKPLRFETGGDYELGTDDLIYPRDNRYTLEWRSSTTTNWDGIIVALIVPLVRVLEVHMTFHTEQWSHVFEASQLPGLHRRFAIDDMGHEIEINGKLVVKRPDEEEGQLHVGTRVFARGEDGIPNDVVIHVYDEGPVAGAEIYVNDELAGETDDEGNLFIFDLPRGEYYVIAKSDGKLGKTRFVIELR
jgi:hypothetical protein